MANENRLINLDFAISKIKDEGLLGSGYSNDERIYDVCDMLKSCPTVDAVEVVHANWDSNGICTMCGYPIPTDSKYDFIDKDDCLFCYHCGAKMDGGNEE